MSTDCFVGIDTSNYTTSVSLCSLDGEVLLNLKTPLPVKAGECGLRQSDAVFAHVKNLPQLMQRLQEEARGKRILAVGVSATPRDAEGSYMPCFLAGISAAQALSAAWDVPLYRFSHQNGHVMAAIYSSGATERIGNSPFAAFHVSGGTTELLHVTPRKEGFEVVQVGGTADLNAGQAIDRIGVLMGLSFPCGKEMEALAKTYSGKIPPVRVSVKDRTCNLSGLQNLAQSLYEREKDPSAVAAYVFAFLGKTLQRMTEQLDEIYPSLPVVYAGGVMSNLALQELLGKRKDTYFAAPAFSADNAAGIALLCRRKHLDGQENQ